MTGRPATVKKTATSAKKPTTSRTRPIAEADARPGVEAWLAHVKPEQQRLVRRLDRLILEAMPEAVCAVKFRKPTNPLGVPFYGLPGSGWIVSINSFKAHVKVSFFAGSALEPAPSVFVPFGRAVDLHSEAELDEKQVKAWLRQAKKLPGWGRL